MKKFKCKMLILFSLFGLSCAQEGYAQLLPGYSPFPAAPTVPVPGTANVTNITGQHLLICGAVAVAYFCAAPLAIAVGVCSIIQPTAVRDAFDQSIFTSVSITNVDVQAPAELSLCCLCLDTGTGIGFETENHNVEITMEPIE